MVDMFTTKRKTVATANIKIKMTPNNHWLPMKLLIKPYAIPQISIINNNKIKYLFWSTFSPNFNWLISALSFDDNDDACIL